MVAEEADDAGDNVFSHLVEGSATIGRFRVIALRDPSARVLRDLGGDVQLLLQEVGRKGRCRWSTICIFREQRKRHAAEPGRNHLLNTGKQALHRLEGQVVHEQLGDRFHEVRRLPPTVDVVGLGDLREHQRQDGLLHQFRDQVGIFVVVAGTVKMLREIEEVLVPGERRNSRKLHKSVCRLGIVNVHGVLILRDLLVLLCQQRLPSDNLQVYEWFQQVRQGQGSKRLRVLLREVSLPFLEFPRDGQDIAILRIHVIQDHVGRSQELCDPFIPLSFGLSHVLLQAAAAAVPENMRVAMEAHVDLVVRGPLRLSLDAPEVFRQGLHRLLLVQDGLSAALRLLASPRASRLLVVRLGAAKLVALRFLLLLISLQRS
mmetsp:Transcript_14833/g.56130  ORF Transcript_14833/g.56130 Transcript_14833/m.56130 type:complete len:374 (-) Transcript_14833:1034-2155(-)|eukprot:scaffold1875_cov253-Pinguiococcus_pyrenoidosus.AAC.19